MELTVNVDMNGLTNYFGMLPENIKKGIAEAVTKSALVVERYEKINAPVDTGRLRSSIMTQLTPSLYPTRAAIGPMVFYAIFINEGTRFIKANPFMDRAAESAENEIADFFNSSIDKALK